MIILSSGEAGMTSDAADWDGFWCIGRLGRMAAFVSQKNNRWLSLNYFLERLNKVTFPSRPTILKPLSETAVKGGHWPSQSDA